MSAGVRARPRARAASKSFSSYRNGMDPRRNQFLTVVSPSPMDRARSAMESQMAVNSERVMVRHNLYRAGPQVNTPCVAQLDTDGVMEASERLRKAREQAGFATAADAARRFGWPESSYRAAENGQRPPTQAKAKEFARAFRVPVEWLLFGTGEPTKKPVPLVGYVGAGAEVFPIDDGGSLDEIEPPPGIGPSAVAVKVRGDSMWPRYMDGDVLIFDEHLPIEKADGQECVVSLTDGRKFVKVVRLEAGGHVTLESFNAKPIRDVEVEWVATIQWIRRAPIMHVNGK